MIDETISPLQMMVTHRSRLERQSGARFIGRLAGLGCVYVFRLASVFVRCMRVQRDLVPIAACSRWLSSFVTSDGTEQRQSLAVLQGVH